MTNVQKSQIRRANRAAKRAKTVREDNRGLWIVVIVLLAIITLFQVGIFGNTMPKECGSCGAIVHDVWSVRNMDDTAFVDVCENCYNDINESGTVYEMNA